MFDVEKPMAYRRGSAEEDMAVGRDLIVRGKPRHGLFFVHLVLEKALKAIVCRVTQNDPPRMHNLVRLSELACIAPSKDQMETLAKMNVFNIEGRYSDMPQPSPTPVEAQAYSSRTEEVYQWLIVL